MTDLRAEIIVFQILTRVTAKDVGRSKTVCKECCALLSTRYFESVHSSRSFVAANQRTLMIRNLTCGVHTINFQTGEYGPETHITCPFHDDITYISILSQLDGLLCAWAQDTHQLFLWNPTTTAYKNLSTTDGLGLYIESTDTLGLYKDTLHDYKIVHVTRNTNALESHIYSRKLASWRKIPFQANVEYVQRSFFWSSGTQCGTSVYFTVCESWTSGKHVVIAFDIVSTSNRATRSIGSSGTHFHVPLGGCSRRALHVCYNRLARYDTQFVASERKKLDQCILASFYAALFMVWHYALHDQRKLVCDD
ncbi:putative F-box associated interaction domain-containing protein [Helianthus debilis subsp. tardiflorus]